jgi:2-keto-3-deoxy-6-phosphogluconate aldolase
MPDFPTAFPAVADSGASAPEITMQSPQAGRALNEADEVADVRTDGAGESDGSV